jgi:peptidyl-prolyl cis-trans isomerase C
MIRSISLPARFLLAFGVLALAPVAVQPALAQAPAAQAPQPGVAPMPSDPSTVVARVGDAEILAGDVAAAYADLPAEYRQMPFAVLYPQLLNQLVNRQLMLKAGLAEKLDEDEAIRASVREFEDFAIQRAYLERYVARVVDEAAVRKEYDATIGAQKGTEQVKASHILLQTEDEAKAVIKALADGGDFAQLARDKSTGPSAPTGGDLGFFAREQMVAPFAKAAFDMKEGETSATPVKTQFGWHVIKVTGRRTQPPPSFEEASEEIRSRLTRDALAAHMTALRDATPVVMLNPDGSPMPVDGAKSVEGTKATDGAK